MYDGEIFEHDGMHFKFETQWDDSGDTPWEREEGHGPVSDWTSRAKRAGELELCRDGQFRRYYDFAEACKLARRDGWGFLPGKLETVQMPDGTWHAYVRNVGNGKLTQLEAKAADINTAIRGVYASHRATMTARQYAAGAAMHDFEYLRAFCNDQWSYIGVIITLVSDDDEPMANDWRESLWGIESGDDDYIEEEAHNLAGEIVHRIKSAA